MKKILALHTGGTISMSQSSTGEVVTNKTNPIANQQVIPLNEIELVNEEVFNLPSPHITPKEMLKITNRIKTAFMDENYDGVVVTHGTDTLEETAYFLDLTLPNSYPVVVTGAMRSSNEIGSDGLYNFQAAIEVAASDDAQNKGVLVAMNEEIHSARFVTKTHTTNVATFRTPTLGPIGMVSHNKAKFFTTLIGNEYCDIETVIDGVYLIKAYAGMDSTIFDILNNDQTKGIVIEGLGAGNVPPKSLPGIKKLIDNEIPVILVSRCYNGTAQPIYDYEGGGIELEKMGLTICHGLNGQKARIKLIVGLSANKKDYDLAQFMMSATS
ncbi:asparaginase [Lactobacillus sp. S2-2]|uniref:asparaginase n=1 Tax=Lactobacillus sp. S2-2 TaxID=2692917 RepID=UPI001F24B8D7|nr:asparaginase [Lactobacillus sp. S2-2]MCF6514707.1 asparaginase [Lactobacillus sp. S2-2]